MENTISGIKKDWPLSLSMSITCEEFMLPFPENLGSIVLNVVVTLASVVRAFVLGDTVCLGA